LEVLRKEGTDGVRYALCKTTGQHGGYNPPAWRHRATAEQKRRAGTVENREDPLGGVE
jgi:hypothetical protein